LSVNGLISVFVRRYLGNLVSPEPQAQPRPEGGLWFLTKGDPNAQVGSNTCHGHLASVSASQEAMKGHPGQKGQRSLRSRPGASGSHGGLGGRKCPVVRHSTEGPGPLGAAHLAGSGVCRMEGTWSPGVDVRLPQ
jgi:hypothetical protein